MSRAVARTAINPQIRFQMSILRFDGVSLEFGDQVILTNAELAIETGERICLIGRNGAGKSTTLKLITGEIEPDRGEVVREPRSFVDTW